MHPKYFFSIAAGVLLLSATGTQAALYPTCDAGKVLSAGRGYIAIGPSKTTTTTDPETEEPVETTIPGSQRVYVQSWAQIQCITPSAEYDGNEKTGRMSEMSDTVPAIFVFSSKQDGLFELAKEAMLVGKTVLFSARSAKVPMDSNPEDDIPAPADDAVKFKRQIVSLAIIADAGE